MFGNEFPQPTLPGPDISDRPNPDADRVRSIVLAIVGVGLSLVAVLGGIYLAESAPGPFPSGGHILIGLGLVFPAFAVTRAVLRVRRRSKERGF